jgi:serine O-acetyltransferase
MTGPGNLHPPGASTTIGPASAPSMHPPSHAGDDFLARICAARRAYELAPQLRTLSAEFVQGVLALLFPHFGRDASQTSRCMISTVVAEHAQLRDVLLRAVTPLVTTAAEPSAPAVADDFFARLPAIRDELLADAMATYESDPAAESLDAVILAYPGFLATAIYRIAHCFYDREVPLFPRLLSEFAHSVTGIDIHPGARIGGSFSIDHGTGVVIGETAVLGNRVKLFQGVTLGALQVRKGLARTKRHPTIDDDVVIYSHATILGGDTVVGAGSVVGGNVWLTHSVPPNSVVTHGRRAEVQHADVPLEFNI